MGYMVDTPTNFYIQNTLGKKGCAGSTAISFDVGMAMIGETAVMETTAEAEVTEGQGHVTEGQDLEAPATTEGEAEGGYEAEAVGDTSADIAACGGCGGC
ncbi:hypothetical protein CHS0354_009580 [Potamilus streckersoni]|uniref:Uncharacterized protein n=1 Tax=Potamilus streckersoni TaxID=2493646 RepID=A0AAE0SPU9_9BIVA|nr:hypothetical protein CHS0354_009580 [Potamilus streckersoni]